MKLAMLFLAVSFLAGARAQDLRHEVEVRETGEAPWRRVPLVEVDVAKSDGVRRWTDKMEVAKFSFAGGHVDVRVRRIAPWREVAIRPLSRGIAAKSDDEGLATFRLERPFYGVVEFDGARFGNLAVFADRPMSPRGDETYSFGPGRHVLDKPLTLKSGESVWLDENAVVDGTVVVTNAENVVVRGLGALRPRMVGPDGRPGVAVANSKNVTIDGPFLTTCPVGGSENVSISNVKSVSSFRWGDGLNVFASTNVTYRNIFARTSDDCTTAYATRKGFNGGVNGIDMQGAVLWADVAHPIEIGLHGNVAVGDVIENLVYRDIDILDQMEMQIDYQGALAITCGDNNTVRNVLFDDIRIERLRRGSLAHVRVVDNRKYCAAPGRLVENIVFRNITMDASGAMPSIVSGYDGTREVRGVRFENLIVGGERIYDKMARRPSWYKTADFVPMFVGEHVRDLVFVDGE